MATTLPLSPITRAPRAPALRRVAWAVLALALIGAAAMIAAIAWRQPPIAATAPMLAIGRAPSAPGAVPLPGLSAAAARVATAPLPGNAAPEAGTTGTIALPALPAAALAAVPVPTVTAAAPFRYGHATPADRGRALQCLTAAVYYEAAGEPDAGQQAVAQVVLNRVRHPAFPGSVCGVVYQGSEGAGCQFSFACDGAMTRHLPAAAGWARAARVAALALGGQVYAPAGLATHYHTYAVTPAWNRALVMTDAVGAHLFHRWKGWWGTAAAFSRRYAGGEPEPGPHLPLQPTSLTPTMPVVSPPVTPPMLIQPAYRASGTMRAVRSADDRLPPAATILPRWRDSGQPLR